MTESVLNKILRTIIAAPVCFGLNCFAGAASSLESTALTESERQHAERLLATTPPAVRHLCNARLSARLPSASTAAESLRLVPSSTQPDYPQAARNEGIEGDVFLEIVLNAQNAPASLCVFKSAHPLLDESAVEYARSARYVRDASSWLTPTPEFARFYLPVRYRLVCC